MTSYRRLRLPGATYFFTVCVEDRGTRTLTDHIGHLREAYRRTLLEFPVTCHAMVVLPDHIHAIWTEPEGEANFPERWRRIKARFSHSVAGDFRPSPSKQAKRERGLWQRRFWEHALRDEAEFIRAMEYCHMNPVKHGLVHEPEHWPYSSFTRRMGNIAHPTENASAPMR
ncbi:MAG: transposase [Proteobacteria bacterium]|nr:transposase [Pseudomonadota bacterium]